MATKKVRVLVSGAIDGVSYQPNQVVEIDAEIIKPYIKEGIVDDAKAAVEYALTETGGKVIRHASPAQAGPHDAVSTEIDAAAAVEASPSA